MLILGKGARLTCPIVKDIVKPAFATMESLHQRRFEMPDQLSGGRRVMTDFLPNSSRSA
jgi:hypothetical protein